MNDNFDKITVRQACALVMLEILGIGFVIMPKLALVLTWRDGLAALFIAAIGICCYAALIMNNINKYGGLDLFSICDNVLGNIPAKLLRYGFIVKTTLLCSFCLRMFAETAAQIMESNIPTSIIMISLGVCILYPVIKGREVRGRLAELFILPVLAIICFVFICAISKSGNDELLPMLSENGGSIITSAITLMLWFYPLEYILMSLPHIKSRQNLTKGCIYSLLTVGMLITAIFAVTIIRFGAAQMRLMEYPVLEIMYSVNLPTSFIERQEGLMLGIWVIGVFFTASGSIYHSAHCAAQTLKGISIEVASIICSIAAIIIGFIPAEGTALYYIINIILFSEGIYLIALPLVLCLAPLWEGRKNESTN